MAQAPIDDLRAPTGNAVVEVADADAAVGLLDGRVVQRDGSRLVVTGMPVVELTRRLVQAGIGVRGAAAERRTLEQTVLELTSHGSDQVDAS